jgi:hypothetical protein
MASARALCSVGGTERVLGCYRDERRHRDLGQVRTDVDAPDKVGMLGRSRRDDLRHACDHFLEGFIGRVVGETRAEHHEAQVPGEQPHVSARVELPPDVRAEPQAGVGSGDRPRSRSSHVRNSASSTTLSPYGCTQPGLASVSTIISPSGGTLTTPDRQTTRQPRRTASCDRNPARTTPIGLDLFPIGLDHRGPGISTASGPPRSGSSIAADQTAGSALRERSRRQRGLTGA